jgi:hypothetical protein
VLHGLERANRLAELLALLRVLDGELERALRRAHSVDHRRDAEPIERARNGNVRRAVVDAPRRRARQRDATFFA